MTFISSNRQRRRANAGSALLVVVVLLLLASLFVIFALNVGRFEQRTSGNDVRAKLAQEAADSGLSLGVEYLNAHKSLFTNNDHWRLCGAAETAFPCGGVPASRRGTMYTYRATVGDTATTMTSRLLPIDSTLANSAAGNFPATRQVGAVLCRVSIVTPAGGGIACADSLADASTTWVVTVVSKGNLTDEGSSSTVTQTLGGYNIFNLGPNVPPLVASGAVAVGGGIQIVTAPDAAGPGVPTSIWTRLDVDAHGTPNTCYFDEFLREGGTAGGTPGFYDGIAACDTCKCPTTGSLSFGKGGSLCEGPDIVDIESSPNGGNAYDKADYDADDVNPAGCPTSANMSITRDEFPDDIFAYIFGQQAWSDTIKSVNPAPTSPCRRDDLECHFAETRIIEPVCKWTDANNGKHSESKPADTCYLLNIKNKIHIGDGINDAAECAALGSGTSGVVWVSNSSCETTIRGLGQLGKPSAPVALIYDGILTQVHFKMYGLLFMREPDATTVLSKDTGGSAELGLNGGAVIYGAAVVQGEVSSGGGGTAAIVYNKDVLFNLINNPDNVNPSSIPGSWTDRLRY